jgi:hypothetical protein
MHGSVDSHDKVVPHSNWRARVKQPTKKGQQDGALVLWLKDLAHELRVLLPWLLTAVKRGCVQLPAATKLFGSKETQRHHGAAQLTWTRQALEEFGHVIVLGCTVHAKRRNGHPILGQRFVTTVTTVDELQAN